MRKIAFALILMITLISLINSVSAVITTISTNAEYTSSFPHDINSVSGVLFLSAINQTLISITKSPLDTAPFCLVFDDLTNQAIVNSTWVNNNCNANIPLIAGRLYRIGTGADGNSYSVSYDQSYTSASYLGIGDFTGGCYGTDCQIYAIASTMYSIENITLDDYYPAPPTPPTLTPIGPRNVTENQTLTIQLHATDPNVNDTLTFLSNAQTVLGTNSLLNSQTGEFTWSPNFTEQGIYFVNFYVTDGMFIDSETVRIQVIDLNYASIAVRGNASIGNTIVFNLNDPQSANQAYILSASFGNSPGIPLGDGRIIPLNNDWLFNAVLYIPSLLGFTNSAGTLDSNGNAQVTWTIPNTPIFQNANIHFGFATLDFNAPGLNFFRSISNAVNVTIQ